MLGKETLPIVFAQKHMPRFHHSEIHERFEDVRSSQAKRMALITLFIRIFSVVRTQVDRLKLKPVSEWAELCQKYFWRSNEGSIKSMICGLIIIRDFCLQCSLRGYMTNQLKMIEHVRNFRFCETCKNKIDEISRADVFAKILDDAPRGQRLLHVLKIIQTIIQRCEACKSHPVITVKFIERSTPLSNMDCNMCELLVLDSIFASIVYEKAPRRMFAVLSFSIDSSNPSLVDVCRQNNLTRWMSTANPEVTVWDIFFISGYQLEDTDYDALIKFNIQNTSQKRRQRSFHILAEHQIKKEHRNCTEPQIKKFTDSLTNTLIKAISALILEQGMCKDCELLVQTWPQTVQEKLHCIQPYMYVSNCEVTFMTRLDPLIKFHRLEPSKDRKNSEAIHYEWVSNMALWIWPAGRPNLYFVSTALAEGIYEVEQVDLDRRLGNGCTLYYHASRSKLVQGYYQLRAWRNMHLLIPYPTIGVYEVKKDINHYYFISPSSDHIKAQPAYEEVRFLPSQPQCRNGNYYIWPNEGCDFSSTFYEVGPIHYFFHLKFERSLACEWEETTEIPEKGTNSTGHNGTMSPDETCQETVAETIESDLDSKEIQETTEGPNVEEVIHKNELNRELNKGKGAHICEGQRDHLGVEGENPKSSQKTVSKQKRVETKKSKGPIKPKRKKKAAQSKKPKKGRRK